VPSATARVTFASLRLCVGLGGDVRLLRLVLGLAAG
jgi:hypothetical protein